MLPPAVVGVMAHNEEANIATCLRAILAQLDQSPNIQSVVVVASGCTDRTVKIVREVATSSSAIRLIVEPHRSGKAAAINLFLRETTEPLCVIVSGDVVLSEGCLAKLIEPFNDPLIGMTGGRPTPTNAKRGLTQNMVHALWELHHELALARPKLGEAVAFRRFGQSLDPRTLADEASMEQVVVSHGLQLCYVPDAVVLNRGAENLADYMRRRVSNHRGHLSLASATGYRPSSAGLMTSITAARSLWRRHQTPLMYLLATAGIEAVARAFAGVSGLIGRKPGGVWRRIATSASVVPAGAPEDPLAAG